MQEIPQTNSQDEQLKLFWDLFFQDKLSSLNQVAISIADPELIAKSYLRQGKFQQAYEELKNSKDSAFKFFVEFLINGNAKSLLELEADSIDTKIYQSQVIFLTRIYWGEQFLRSIECNKDPDRLLEEVFDELIDKQEYDKAILSSIQAIELLLEEQVLSTDIHMPIIEEQLQNLLMLSEKAKYSSTRAKIFLLKGKIFRDRQAAQDAEILFGKEGNTNGLGEVYLFYAKEFNDEKYYEKSLKNFIENNNTIAQAFIYESIASKALISGQINEASKAFDRASELMQDCGLFEKYAIDVQRISLLAIRGKYQKVKEAIHELVRPKVPPFFIAQAYQILANTLIQLGEDLELAKGYIETATEIFKQLKRYTQLLHSLSIHFQILILDDDLQSINKLGQEIIQLATRLGNEEVKAGKYLEMALVTIKYNLDHNMLDQSKLDEAYDYFNKAINLYKELGNLIGEADAHQAIGNMYTNLGKLEEALKAFLTAKKIYHNEKAFLQEAISDSLIGILLLNYVVLNEQTYSVASKHFEHALHYFSKENILDLNWKTNFYLAELNYKYYLMKKDAKDSEQLKNKAKSYFLEMFCAVEDFEEEAPGLNSDFIPGSGITLEEAFRRAYQFFIGIGEDETAKRFTRYKN